MDDKGDKTGQYRGEGILKMDKVFARTKQVLQLHFNQKRRRDRIKRKGEGT